MISCALCVIENDPIAVFGLQKMLERTNYVLHVEVFENGAEALQELRPHLEHDTDKTPDIIFLDLNMPIMDGWEFIEEYTKIKRPPKSKIILMYVVSSSILQKDRERVEKLSAVTDYIVKPVTHDDLKEIFEDDLQEVRKIRES